MTDWNALTKEELVHLLEGDMEVDALIRAHLSFNIMGQATLGARCRECEIIARKLGLVINESHMSKLEALKLIRWMLHHIGFADHGLRRAQKILTEYETVNNHGRR